MKMIKIRTSERFKITIYKNCNSQKEKETMMKAKNEGEKHSQ